MDIDVEKCISIPISWTEADDEGKLIGFGNLGDKIAVIGISPGGQGELNIISKEQAYSLHTAMERFEAGYEEVVRIAPDGLAEREVLDSDDRDE